MEITKRLNLSNIFIFLFFVVFPFGQIIRIGVLQPIDVVAGLGAAYAIFRKYKKPEVFKFFETSLFIAGFSWIFGSMIFKQIEVFYGLLYLVRLFAYYYFFVYVWHFVKENSKNIKLLTDSLLAVSIVSAIFGWVQYFVFPSIIPFIVWGWDDHLFRLVGTFLDPAFLGLIIVLGLLLSINRFIYTKKKNNLFIICFLLISLAFTYSRASYLAFLAGVVVIGFYQKRIRQLIYIVIALVALIVVLPTSGNHILGITRAFSAIARVQNYQETLNIFKTSPIFGVGYDNLCLAKSRVIGYINFNSHSCSGSDSSLLFVLATTGIVGLITFINFIFGIAKSLKKNPNLLILVSSFVAVGVHCLFSNSLFYPWVMGWMLVLLAVNLRGEG